MMTEEHRALHRHPAPHRELIRRYRHYASQQKYRISFVLSVILFAASVVVNFYAGVYATERASNPVTDIILSNTPVFDVDTLFVYGSLLLIAFLTLLCFAHPKRVPFTLHTLTLLILIRSVFISLTHIGPFPDQVILDLGAVTSKFIFGGDLFFSNHTAIPFMMALVYWREKKLRIILIAWSIFFATIALLGHLHYTIDVLSAYFITYTIFCVALWLFPKDRALFLEDEVGEV